MSCFGCWATLHAIPGWRWSRAAGVGAGGAVLVAVPSDLLDTAWFTRMTPVPWWGLGVAAAGVVLAAVAAGLGARPGGARHEPAGTGSSPWAGLGGIALAVGCPVCNKIVVMLLGASGALERWAPVQPLLGGIAVLLLGLAVTVRWPVDGLRTCPGGSEPCGTDRDQAGTDDVLGARRPTPS